MNRGDSTTWRRTTLALTWATSLVLVSVLGSRAAPPPPSSRTQLNFQARLTSPDGQPLSGEFALQFNIFDVPIGGVPLWSESHDGTALPRVRVVNGILSSVLGQAVPLDATVFDPGGAGDRYVAVELAGEELCRVKLTATAYALSATVANGLWNPVTSTSLDAQTLEDRFVDTAEVEAFVPPATTDVAGKVLLAAHDATTAGAAVQGSDPRLAGIRVRTNGGSPTSRRAQVNLIAGPNVTIGAVDGGDEVDVTVSAANLVGSVMSHTGNRKIVTVPAGTLATDGDALHVWASGTIGASAGLRVTWAGISVFASPDPIDGGLEPPGTWVIEGYLIRESGNRVIASFHCNVQGQDADIGSQVESFVQPWKQMNANVAAQQDVVVEYANPQVGGEVNVLRVRNDR